MKKCIYLKHPESYLSFTSKEHIIPAGIGGLTTLDLGVVSDQANNIFSGIELYFMRNSVISLLRQFFGPGKRGSLSPKRATRSHIHVMTNINNPYDVNLGYLRLGQPHLIPQILITTNNEFRIMFDKFDGDFDKQFDNFVEDLKTYDGKYINIFDSCIPEKYILLGKYQNKWYLALPEKDIDFNVKNIIQEAINVKLTEQPQYAKENIKSYQKIAFGFDNCFRVCAKIVFNFLASSKGIDFVMRKKFDPIRNWIVSGGENRFVNLSNRPDGGSMFDGFPFPETAHRIIISKIGNQLIGVVSFYGNHFETVVLLCDNYHDRFELEGFICDWENKKELSFIDYMNFMFESNGK